MRSHHTMHVKFILMISNFVMIRKGTSVHFLFHFTPIPKQSRYRNSRWRNILNWNNWCQENTFFYANDHLCTSTSANTKNLLHGLLGRWVCSIWHKYGDHAAFFLWGIKCPCYQALITDHFRETGGHYLLIAGAMPPTDPGPGMFPATAAAWAAAAAWAVAACCCICRWHWRRSNTCITATRE